MRACGGVAAHPRELMNNPKKAVVPLSRRLFPVMTVSLGVNGYRYLRESKDGSPACSTAPGSGTGSIVPYSCHVGYPQATSGVRLIVATSVIHRRQVVSAWHRPQSLVAYGRSGGASTGRSKVGPPFPREAVSSSRFPSWWAKAHPAALLISCILCISWLNLERAVAPLLRRLLLVLFRHAALTNIDCSQRRGVEIHSPKR